MRFASPTLPSRRFVLPLLAVMAVSSASVSHAEIAWQTDLRAAHASAQAQNKPLLLHFTSDNCVWCDRLEAGAFQSAEVQAAVAGGFVPLKVHAAEAPQLVKMFGVKGFPTDVVVWPTGQTLSHSVSPQDPNKYIAMLAASQTKIPAATPPAMPAAPQPTATPPAGTQYVAAPPAPPTASAPGAAPSSNQVPAMTASAQSRPGQYPGSATAQLAGARTDGMSLGMPAQADMAAMEADVQSAADDASPSTSKPKLAMEGFCAVTVIDEQRWSEGNPKFGVIHLGKLYLFESQDKMATFLADPTPYTPVLNEIDVIRFFEERRVVPGKRQFGVQDPIHGRMFFFADEAALNHFDKEYQRYVDAAIDVMAQAVANSNP